MLRGRPASIPIALAVVLGVVAIWVSVASASLPLKVPRQQTLLNQACGAAKIRIQQMLKDAATTQAPTQATTQAPTIETQVRVLAPGKLSADIVFNPSGSNINVAADPAATGPSFGCGFGESGQRGSGVATLGEGPGLPTKHLVSVVRETFTHAGRYTLTFKLDRRGEKILARLGAAERAYRKRHPHGHNPPEITWGVGIHYRSNG